MKGEESTKALREQPAIEHTERQQSSLSAVPSFDCIELLRSAETSGRADSALPAGMAKGDLLLAQLEPYQVRGYVKDALGHLDAGHPSAEILRKMLEEDQKPAPWRPNVGPLNLPDVW